MSFIRACAAFVGRQTRASDRRERAFNQTNDLAELDLRCWSRQRVATKFSPSGRDESSGFELDKDLLQELDRQPLFGLEFTDLNDRSAQFLRDSQINHRPEGVFTSFG